MTQETATLPTEPFTPATQASPTQAWSVTHPAETVATTPEAGDPFAITSFMLGLVSVVSGLFLFAPVLGLIFGILAKKRGTLHSAFASWGIGLSVVMLAVWLTLVFVAASLFGLAFIAAL